MKPPAPEGADPTRLLKADGTLAGVPDEPQDSTRLLRSDGTLAAPEEPREPTRLLSPTGTLATPDDERPDTTEKHVRVDAPMPDVGDDPTKLLPAVQAPAKAPAEVPDETAKHFRVDAAAPTVEQTRIVASTTVEQVVPEPSPARGAALLRSMRGLVVPIVLALAATANWWLTMKVERTCMCGAVQRPAERGYRWEAPNCVRVCAPSASGPRGTMPRPASAGGAR